MPCLEDFIDCDIKELSVDQLFRLLLAATTGGDAAIRTCVSNGDEIGGLCNDEFVASAGQTNFVLANPVRKQIAVFVDGAIQGAGYGSYTIGNPNVTLPAQADGSVVQILS